MLNTNELNNRVEELLEDIRSASYSLQKLVDAKNLVPIDAKAGLTKIAELAAEVKLVRDEHQEELTRRLPHFAPLLSEAYKAVADTGAAIDPAKRPDLYELANSVNHLLRSIDEPSVKERRSN